MDEFVHFCPSCHQKRVVAFGEWLCQEVVKAVPHRHVVFSIPKIYEVNPLVCPKCQGMMRVVAFIENPDVIKKILKHLGQWDVKRKPRPTANAPPIDVFPTYDEQPGPNTDDYITDPDYPAEAYF